MIVPSFQFLAFAAVAALVFNLSRSVRWQNLVLVLVNLSFLSTFSHDPAALVPFAAFLGVGFAGARAMQAKPGLPVFVPLLALMIVMFFWLKRYAFVPSVLLLDHPYVTIGVSYVFFRMLHLIIDARSPGLLVRISPVVYLNYVLNFTSLVSGPIQRFQDYYATQTDERLLPDVIDYGRALERIVFGFFKVAIVSMVLSRVQHQALGALSPAQPVADRLLNGVVIAAVYPLYLYFNFSGYTDVVMGVARFFGIALPPNFNRPFSSTNFINFWARWHITLSTWLKTYVYNPLLITLMKRFPSRKAEPYLGVFAFFVTFFLVGAWHGQTSMFLFFGLLQGGGVSVNKLYQILMTVRLGKKRYIALCDNGFYSACTRGLTFTFFAFSLFWFWSTWAQMNAIVAALGWGTVALVWLLVFAGASLLLALLHWAHAGALLVGPSAHPLVLSRYTRTAWSTALAVITVLTLVISSAPAPDIVYKTF
ncbi:MBOAT family O-acyltransferase [Paraburkholderia sp. BL10I2N1]|uniref:MBOAT family O-acyltransferase n=1 Tax=Paraburkholderia sp. BL10I2N1 TaxID=1938796 RepID=UPI00106228A9|nr:MBOAT family O-acyltransferase [Paraburkholderia sp. BL10I2N1]TDN67454.1 D-alanyl-lipoteichoic acid acyltransferase DltB (MBOAT superfamily) [Paraburkholderia sp. BL10I2N1]